MLRRIEPVADSDFRPIKAVVGLMAALVCFGALAGSAAGQEPASGSAQGTPEEQLIARHAPILLLKEQERPCASSGEPYDAGPVEIVLGDPAVQLRRDEPGQPVVKTGPTAADLAGLDDTYYLDYPGDPLRPGCGYERRSRERMQGQVPTTHARIAREGDRDGFAIQYWFFYYFNDFNNKHEGDWEMIQVVFDVDTVEEALGTEPIEVGYAQHGGGEWAAWDDDKFEHEDGHPIVYVSRGSHASQFDSAIYLGWGENGTGFGCDDTTGPSVRVPLAAAALPEESDPTGPVAWTTFGGRWGQRETWEFDGPKSPNLGDKWAHPLSWQEQLRPASLAVPLSGTVGPAPTKAFCRISATSADLFRIRAERPWLAGLYLAAGVAIPLALIAISWRTLRAALLLYVRHLPVFLPAAAAVLAVGALFGLIRWLGDLAFGAGPLADVPTLWSILSFLINLAQQVGSLVLIAPAAIYAAAEVSAGRRPHPLALLHQERTHLARVLRALLRPFLFIALLGLLPFGAIPATYRTVQRIFIPHAVLLDDAGPVEARARSVETVKGRWWRTSALAATLTALVAIPGPVVGLLLLVFAARSVGFVNLASSLIYALVYPFVFAATTHYYLALRPAEG